MLPRRLAPVVPGEALMPGTLQAALEHQQAGRLEAAQRIYRKVLEQEPDNADALHLLGACFFQAGRHETAVEYIRRAIARNPSVAFYHLNLGNALQELGRIEEAELCYRQALRLDPKFSEAHNNLGNVLSRLGRLEEAAASLGQALRLRPDEPLAHNNRGALWLKQRRFAEAEAACREALRLRPAYAEACNNLAVALLEQGRMADGEALCREALRLKPGYAEAHNTLGVALERQGRPEEALPWYQGAVRWNPASVEASNNCGSVLVKLNRLEEAGPYFSRALELRPDDPEALNNLGNLRQFRGQVAEAIALYRRALALQPDFHIAHSNLVFCLNYDPGCEPADLFREHRRWAERHAAATPFAAHSNDPDPNRRLRLGYVSPDFRGHPVAFFLEPVLEAHRREAFEVTCYSNVARPDDLTARFAALADHWRPIHGLPDGQVADEIRADRIDILVDLAGFTTGGRLLVLARKPAPVQVSWLGYPNTTGLPTVDYRLTDAWADPPGETDAWHTEELVRLPRGFLCYRPPGDAPPAGELPSLGAGRVTFGCFNNLAKVTPGAIAAWAAILDRLPGSRLVLKSKPLADAGARRQIQEEFLRQGIPEPRLVLMGPIPAHSHHLQLYNEIDIALDTFPYNGTTTTCEALWMGVPVITVAGRRHASRVGASLLWNVGLPELIARSADESVELAVALARDGERMRRLRAGLRDRMARSALTGASAFTEALEQAYRRMWRRWCGSNR